MELPDGNKTKNIAQKERKKNPKKNVLEPNRWRSLLEVGKMDERESYSSGWFVLLRPRRAIKKCVPNPWLAKATAQQYII